MLTFFRRIRKELLDGGATRKYLLYAIGEIALVVIGILIALQINNWNENKSKSLRENDYLMALSADFNQTKSEFENNKNEHQTVKVSMKLILDWAESGSVPLDEQPRFDSVFGGVFWHPSFDPPLGTIEAILGSGNVDLIENRELVSQLTQWTSFVDNYRSVESRAVDHFYQVIYPFMSERVNLQDLDKGIPTELPWAHDSTDAYLLVSNQGFQNMIYWHWVIQWNIERYALNIDTSIERILYLVNSELGEIE